MKTNIQTRRGFTLVELLVVIVIIASLAGLTAPMVIRQRKKADQTEATNNARQVGFAMLEFEAEYGRYPDDATQPLVSAAFATATVVGSAGNGSNGYFHQLFEMGLTQSEAMFYAKAASTKKPDGDITDNMTCLAAGEAGFGYFFDGAVGDGMTASGNPARILLATPCSITVADQFDGDPFDRKAVVLRIDNSVSSLNIDGDATNQGPAKIAADDIFDAPIWGATVPVLELPTPL